MPKIYDEADKVAKLANMLIPKHHPDLATARIKYIFVSEGSKKNGKIVPGKTKKMSGASQYLADCDFVIEVALDAWNDLMDTQREALIDHLLERCQGVEDEETGDMKWSTKEPDVQEFKGILERHGAWHPDLRELVSVAKMIHLEEIVNVDDVVIKREEKSASIASLKSTIAN